MKEKEETTIFGYTSEERKQFELKRQQRFDELKRLYQQFLPETTAIQEKLKALQDEYDAASKRCQEIKTEQQSLRKELWILHVKARGETLEELKKIIYQEVNQYTTYESLLERCAVHAEELGLSKHEIREGVEQIVDRGDFIKISLLSPMGKTTLLLEKGTKIQAKADDFQHDTNS